MKQVKIVCLLLVSMSIFIPVGITENAVHTDNIVVILDASGSMKDKFRADMTKSKMDAAKAALQEVLAKVPDGTNIGLLVFSGNNIPDAWVYPLGPKDTAKLLSAINLPQPGGGTPLGTYIRIGANRLLEQREKQYNYGTYRLLVVTDGEAQDPEKVAQYTPEILNRQIRVDVIGVDMKTDHMLAKDVDGYRKADNPGELVAAVSQILAETTATTSDVDGEDAFEYIAPLSSEIAEDLIARLTRPPSNTAISTTVERIPPQPKTPPTQSTQPTPQRKQSSGNGTSWLVVIVVLGIIGFVVLRRTRR